jgi:hypothetical protein
MLISRDSFAIDATLYQLGRVNLLVPATILVRLGRWMYKTTPTIHILACCVAKTYVPRERGCPDIH